MLDLRVYIDSQWQSFFLTKDTSISIEENSPVWDTGASTFSEEFTIPVEPNIHILGNLESMRGADVYSLLYGCRFQLWVDGIMFRSGVIHLDDELDIEYDPKNDCHTIAIELASNKQELSEILDGVNCQDLPISEDNIQIGFANKEEMDVDVYYAEYPSTIIEHRSFRTFNIPRIMIPKGYVPTPGGYVGENDFVNSSKPYDPSAPALYPYCNVKLCHQHYTQNGNEWNAERNYDVSEVDRVNSSPCIYVGYFLHKVFSAVYSTKNGPVSIDVKYNALNDIPDFLRLAFFHVDCQYDEVETGRIMNYNNSAYDAYMYFALLYNSASVRRTDAPAADSVEWQRVPRPVLEGTTGYPSYWSDYANSGKKISCTFNVKECRAILNAKNLPDQDVMSVIEALQNAFNARFIYDSNGSVMSIVLVSDILSQEGYTEIPCVVSNVYQTQNNTRGFRLKYNSAQEIYENPITHKQVLIGTKEDKNGSSVDTTFNYNDYTRVVPMESYNTVLANITPYTMDLFLDPVTGNAYRVKVDKDAKESNKLYPSTFEVGGYGDVEYGDCSDDDFTEEVVIGFNPAIPNDVKSSDEMKAVNENTGEIVTPEFAQFVDVEVHRRNRGENSSYPNEWPPETIDFDVMLDRGNSFYINWSGPYGEIPEYDYFAYTNNARLLAYMFSKDSYDFGNSNTHPFNTIKQEFTLGILRDSDTTPSPLNIFNVNYDGENNSEWSENKMNSTGGFTSDSFDQYGNLLCYHARERITVNKSNVNELIDRYFPKRVVGEDGSVSGSCNVDLRSSARYTTKEAMQAEYPEFDGDYATYYSSSKWLAVSPGKGGEVLYTPITDNGNVLNRSYLDDRLAILSGQVTTEKDLVSLDATDGSEPVIIGVYDSPMEADAYADFLHVLGEVYYDENSDIERSAYAPIPGEQFKSLSLKLKAEKKNPYYDPATKTCSRYQELTDLATGYFKVDPKCARRGLFDNFYEEYAYWVVNRRIAHITASIELASLLNIDFTKKYKIGEYLGFIKSVSYSISNDGLSLVDIELYYL